MATHVPIAMDVDASGRGEKVPHQHQAAIHHRQVVVDRRLSPGSPRIPIGLLLQERRLLGDTDSVVANRRLEREVGSRLRKVDRCR